jgi:predicted site-specific integrase-resolvase
MENLEYIENLVKSDFNLPKFELRYLSMCTKEVKDFVTKKRIEILKLKCEKLTEELTNDINEILSNLEYKENSVFSYNIDRLQQFNNETQSF